MSLLLGTKSATFPTRLRAMEVVLIAPENAKDIILLEHPRTGKPCQFLLTSSNTICEIIQIARPHKQSLFYGDNIISDAPIHIATPFDATFLLISHLRKEANAQQFSEIDELLEAFPPRLHEQLSPLLMNICDSLDMGSGEAGAASTLYRSSKEKIESYLQTRVARVQDALPASIVDKLPSSPEFHSLARQKAAFELVSSYLTPTHTAELAAHYDFTRLEEHFEAQKSEYINPNEFIGRQGEDETGTAVTGPTTKKIKKGSKGVESLKKVNTKGMKSMTSFFAKKGKT